VHAAARLHMYERGVTMFRQGDEPQGLFVVCSGWTLAPAHARALDAHVEQMAGALGLAPLVSTPAFG